MELDLEMLKDSHNATHSLQQQTLNFYQQQTSTLQLNIHRIEMAVEALEQQESVVSTTESFILNRLKAVEKSPEEIIKEALEDFVPEPAQVAMVIPNVLQLLSPPVKNHTELDTTKKTVFAMDISVTKNLVTGERAVPPEELHQLNQVWDSRKCVQTLDSQQYGHTLFCCQREPQDDYHYCRQGNHYSEEKRHNQTNQKDSYHFGSNKTVGYYYGNCPYSCCQVNSVYTHRSAGHHSNSFIRGNRVNGVKPNDCPPPKSHDQDTVSAYPKQICYTPANYILPSNYINVDEEFFCYSPPSYQNTAHYSGPIASDRGPPSIYGDDALYTILNTMETTEPTTVIFMGFQMIQDDGHSQELVKSSLKAELVFLEDSEENGKDISIEKRRSHAQRGANGDMRLVEECRDRQTERQVQKKHKPCCTVC